MQQARWANTGVRYTDVNRPIPVTNVSATDTARGRLFSTRRFTMGNSVVNSHHRSPLITNAAAALSCVM
jgi:hypothetical protein